MTATLVSTDPANERLLGSVDRWALVAGVTGCVANGLLLTLWTVAIPGNAAYEWTVPANDVTGAVATAATLPVVFGLTRHLGDTTGLRFLARAAVGGGVAMVVSAGLLVAGAISFEAGFVAGAIYIPALFGWTYAAGRAARRTGRLTPRLAFGAEALGLATLVAMPLAGVAALLPPGSGLRYAVGAACLGPGLAGFVGHPLWLLGLSRHLASPTP